MKPLAIQEGDGNPVLDLIHAATLRASKGRTSNPLALAGRERRRMSRILARRERRLTGVYPVGAIASALCHRTRTAVEA